MALSKHDYTIVDDNQTDKIYIRNVIIVEVLTSNGIQVEI